MFLFVTQAFLIFIVRI